MDQTKLSAPGAKRTLFCATVLTVFCLLDALASNVKVYGARPPVMEVVWDGLFVAAGLIAVSAPIISWFWNFFVVPSFNAPRFTYGHGLIVIATFFFFT